jgi:hypothetical protein
MKLLPLILLGCNGTPQSKPLAPEPTFLEVSGSLEGMASDDTGDDGQGILEFSNEGRTINVTATTLDRNSEPYDYDGWVEVTIRPGTIKGVSGATQTTDTWGEEHWFVQAVDGQVSTQVSFSSSFGDTRVWMAAVGDIEDTSIGASFATGVTGPLAVQLPTIAQMQDVSELEIDEPFTSSPMTGEFVTLRTDDREVVVTTLTTKGFWASDLGDAPGNYSGLFVYTFNKPEGVAVGDRLSLLGGGVQEYVGATQISFPLYEAMDGETLEPPPASVLSDETLCADDRPNNGALEAFESSLVTVAVGTIPEDFKETPPGIDSDLDYAQYLEYGQWPIELPGGCRVYVVSNTTAPEFDPVAHAGQDVGPITGMLSYVRAGGHKWMVLVRNPEDLGLTSDEDAEVPDGPPWPLPLHRGTLQPQCEHDHIGAHAAPRKD